MSRGGVHRAAAASAILSTFVVQMQVCAGQVASYPARHRTSSEDWEADELSWGYPSKQKDFKDSLNKEKYKLKTTFHLNIRLSKYSLSFRKLAALHNHYKSSS